MSTSPSPRQPFRPGDRRAAYARGRAIWQQLPYVTIGWYGGGKCLKLVTFWVMVAHGINPSHYSPPVHRAAGSAGGRGGGNPGRRHFRLEPILASGGIGRE